MDKLLLGIFCVLALYSWVTYRISNIRERQAACHHQWEVMDIPDPAIRLSPFVSSDNIPKHKIRNCLKCKKQETWNAKLNQWV